MNLHHHARLGPRGRALLANRIIVHGLPLERPRTPLASASAPPTSGSSDSGRKGLWVCSIAPPGPMPVHTQRRRRSWIRCWSSAARVRSIARSPGNCPWRRAPWLDCCGVPACIDWPNWNRPCRRTATNTPARRPTVSGHQEAGAVLAAGHRITVTPARLRRRLGVRPLGHRRSLPGRLRHHRASG